MIHWAIPENIYTIRRMAFWNSESKGHSLNWKSKGIVRGWEGGGGVSYDWNSEGMEGFLDPKRSGISTGNRQECIP